MDAVLEDHEAAPIGEEERALLSLVEKANNETAGVICEGVAQADVDRAREAGWSEEAVYDALTVCSLFNFYNSWVDAAGVEELSEEEYAASGRRLATQGYLSDPESDG